MMSMTILTEKKQRLFDKIEEEIKQAEEGTGVQTRTEMRQSLNEKLNDALEIFKR